MTTGVLDFLLDIIRPPSYYTSIGLKPLVSNGDVFLATFLYTIFYCLLSVLEIFSQKQICYVFEHNLMCKI